MARHRSDGCDASAFQWGNDSSLHQRLLVVRYVVHEVLWFLVVSWMSRSQLTEPGTVSRVSPDGTHVRDTLSSSELEADSSLVEGYSMQD